MLIDKPIKMPTSDINAHLKHKDLDEIKKLCEELYDAGEISFGGNGRYFILSEETKKLKRYQSLNQKPLMLKKSLRSLRNVR